IEIGVGGDGLPIKAVSGANAGDFVASNEEMLVRGQVRKEHPGSKAQVRRAIGRLPAIRPVETFDRIRANLEVTRSAKPHRNGCLPCARPEGVAHDGTVHERSIDIDGGFVRAELVPSYNDILIAVHTPLRVNAKPALRELRAWRRSDPVVGVVKEVLG